MIDVKSAAAAALRYVRELYPDSELEYLRVEEVEFDEDGKTWNVTVGWVEHAVRAESPMTIGSLTRTQILTLPRVYKRVAVDAETGAVRSMKIRSVG